ncbi:hypothetical protein RHECNPAF_470059 [Rhizobium etli CNPAF512]|nr:hypothetical protein RHECNPAF_470059 [Rhizobium etli CNPAF512]
MRGYDQAVGARFRVLGVPGRPVPLPVPFRPPAIPPHRPQGMIALYTCRWSPASVAIRKGYLEYRDIQRLLMLEVDGGDTHVSGSGDRKIHHGSRPPPGNLRVA